MPEDYKDKYLDERFSGIKALIISNNDMVTAQLSQILQQTSKTNGTVADVIERLEKVERKQLSCPANDFYKFKDEMAVPHFYARYPKLLNYTIMGIFLIELVVGGLIIISQIV